MTGSKGCEGVRIGREVVELVRVGFESVEDVDVVNIGQLGKGYLATS
jgi:hypothetical protein